MSKPNRKRWQGEARPGIPGCAGVVAILSGEPKNNDPGPWHAYGQGKKALYIERRPGADDLMGYGIQGVSHSPVDFESALLMAYSIWKQAQG